MGENNTPTALKGCVVKKKNSMFLGLVVFEKLFMRTPTLQSDDIKFSELALGIEYQMVPTFNYFPPYY